MAVDVRKSIAYLKAEKKLTEVSFDIDCTAVQPPKEERSEPNLAHALRFDTKIARLKFADSKDGRSNIVLTEVADALERIRELAIVFRSDSVTVVRDRASQALTLIG